MMVAFELLGSRAVYEVCDAPEKAAVEVALAAVEPDCLRKEVDELAVGKLKRRALRDIAQL